MPTFALRKMESIKGTQEFDKLVVDDCCPFEEFESGLEEQYKQKGNIEMTREELLKSPAYWTAGLQMELYRQIADFMETHQMNKTQLAEYLGCSKGYVSQLLSGDFDHKLSKFVELSLAIGKIPEISFTDVEQYILSDQREFN